MKRHPQCALALVATLVGSMCFAQTVAAQLVFDNGGANTLNTPTGDPPVNVIVQDSLAAAPTSLTVEDGADIGGGSGQSVGLFGQSVFVMTGGTASGDLLATDTATATISGGTFGDDLFVSGSAEVTLSVATFDDVQVSEQGTVYVLDGGQINDDAFFRNSSRLVMSGGTLPDEVEIRDSSTALFTGGVIGDDLVVGENAIVVIESLTIDDAIEAEGTSTTTIFAGNFGAVEAIENARIDIFGGQFGQVFAANSAVIIATAGTISDGAAATQGGRIDLDGVAIEAFDGSELRAVLNGKLNVKSVTATELDVEAGNGGVATFEDFTADAMSIAMIGGGVANLLGGTANSLDVQADVGSVLNLKGGDFADINVELLSQSVMNVYGLGFTYNGIPVEDLNDVLGAGAFVPETGELRTIAGDISGLLADGSPFSLTFSRSFINPPARVFLVKIPEPSAVVPVAIAVCGLVFARRRSSR